MYGQVPGCATSSLSVHCHNDLGLATANTLAGVLGGARQVESCINGIGERAGNASLEEVAMATASRAPRSRRDHAARSRRSSTGRRDSCAAHRDARPAEQGHRRRQRLRARVRHPPGRHAQGPATYEIMEPEQVGAGSSLVLGKHSRPHALQRGSSELGYRLDGEELKRAFVRFKALADTQARRHRSRPRGDRRRRASGRRGDLPARGPAGQLRHQLRAHRHSADAPRRRREPRGGGHGGRAGGRRLQGHRRARAGAMPSSRSSRCGRSPRASTRSAR